MLATYYTVSLTWTLALERLRDSVAYFLHTCLNDYLLCWGISFERTGAMSYIFTSEHVPVVPSEYMASSRCSVNL